MDLCPGLSVDVLVMEVGNAVGRVQRWCQP